LKRLIDWAVEHPVSVGVLFFALISTSIYSIRRLKFELFPRISLPTFTVITAYPGASVYEVETNVTKPLEKVLKNLSGVREIYSKSIEEYSQITVHFNPNTNLSKAFVDMTDKIRSVKLPEGTLPPSIIPFDPSVFPVMTVTFLEDELVKSLWVDRVSTLQGVALVPLLKTYEDVISIRVYSEKLAFFGIRPTQIFGALYEKRFSFPLEKSEVLGSGKVDLRDIENTIVGARGNRGVFLYEVAEVKIERENYEVLQLNNGFPVMVSPVFKTSDANAYEVSKSLKKILEEIRRDGRLKFWIAMDQGFLIEKVIKEAINSAIIGGILAIIVVILFTKSIRLSLIIALSIPLSLSIALVIMDFAGYGLNAMTLAGIALAVGMLVDNAVVVSENIFRYVSLGYDPRTASKGATKEVIGPIISSTITSIIVFAPVVYLSGSIGEISRNVAIAFVSSLAATILISTMITPAYAQYILAGVRGSAFAFGENYKKLLVFLKKRKLHLPIFVLLLFPLTLLFKIGGEFIPSLDTNFIFLDIELPSNTPFEKTALYMRNVSNLLSKTPEIENYAVFVSAPKDVPKGIVAYGGGITETYKGQAFIRLKERTKRKRAQWEIEEIIRENLPEFSGAKVRFLPVERITLFGLKGKSVYITFWGDDREILENIARRFAEDLKKVKGLTNVVVEIPPKKDVVLYKFDELAKVSSLPISEIEKDIFILKSDISALEVENLPVKLRYDGDINSLPVSGKMRFYAGDFLKAETLKVPSVMTGYNGLPSITVSADRTSPNLLRIALEIQDILKGYRLPKGFGYTLSGEIYELFEMIKQLTLAGILALILIFSVMVLQFESLREPYYIFLSTIFSLSGSLLFLYIFNVTLSIVSLLGILISFGVVVNNGIVMLNLAKRVGILEAAKIRLRPILITNITSLIGLLPLILLKSEGFEYRQPVAVALMGGMIFGLLYSTLILPLIYNLPPYNIRYGRDPS
jgi:HAE1 family hydrophobic/amphiphilic exporter-1